MRLEASLVDEASRLTMQHEWLLFELAELTRIRRMIRFSELVYHTELTERRLFQLTSALQSRGFIVVDEHGEVGLSPKGLKTVDEL